MSKNQKNVFITGATGFLGSFLVRELLDKGYKVFALARAKDGKSAQARVDDALKFVYEDEFDSKFMVENLKVIEGDIVLPDLGIKKSDLEYLRSKVDIIIHNAAIINQREVLEKQREVNVKGTHNVLFLALHFKNKGRLKKVNYVSTAFIVGKKEITFDETMLDVGQEFFSDYEKTKFEAEVLIRNKFWDDLDISIFRPSLIMGDSKTGKILNFNLFYHPLRHFLNNVFVKYPADFNCFQNFINVDTVASAIAVLAERAEKSVYHIVSPQAVSIKSFIKAINNYFNLKLPEFVPVEEFDFSQLTFVQRAMLEPFAPYFNYKAKFESKSTQRILSQYNYEFPKIDSANFKRIFSYCCNSGFVKLETTKKG